MQSENSMRGLLEIIAAAGGEADTRIRIQKEAFLLAALGLGGFGLHGFDYHHYGPFNRALSDTLHSAVNLGLLEEKKETFDSGNLRYSYALTDAGREWVDEKSSRFNQLSEILARLNQERWRTLELAATAVFLEKRHKLKSKDIAFSEALKKKPETQPYEKQARALLDDLRL